MKLIQEYDQIFALLDDDTRLPVTIVKVRPSTGEEISIMHGGSELRMLRNSADLGKESQEIIEKSIDRTNFCPEITRIVKTEVYLGNRYFHVETTCGNRSFIIKNPYVDIRSIQEDQLQIRDVIGNRYMIRCLSKLDKKSLRELEKVI